MAQEILALREQLKSSPMDWSLRLSLADALAREGLARQAAIVVSSAPSEPTEPADLARAAAHLLELDSDLAIRYANAALTQDETHAGAALTRAEAHRRRGEAAEARRFFVVATALDPTLAARAAELGQWLAEHKQEVVNPGTVPKPRETEPPPAAKHEATRLISTAPAARHEAPPARPAPKAATVAHQPITVAHLAPPAAAPQAHESEAAKEDDFHATVVPDEDDAPSAVVIADEDDDPVVATVSPARVMASHEAAPPSDHKAGDVAHPASGHDDPAAPGESALLPAGPAQNRLLAQKLSAASVAILVHVALFFLLGVFVILVPEPKVAELVGVVAPEAVQEMPEVKQVIPSAMPSPSVASGAERASEQTVTR